MESRVNGRASAESARIDGEIKAQKVEHSAELRAVLGAIKSLEQNTDLKLEAMEERRVADMKAMEERRVADMKAFLAEMKAMEERLSAKMEAMEERRVADMKALKTELALKIQIAEAGLRGEIRLLKWGIGLILAFAVPTAVRVFSPQLISLLFGS